MNQGQSAFPWQGVFVVVGALIAALVALRNARKHPYEQLKALVEIVDKLPQESPGREALLTAIERHTREIERLNNARTQGRAFFVWIWMQSNTATIASYMFTPAGTTWQRLTGDGVIRG